ncbi:phosphonate metabolism protein/1,5-bisphosphokinase (PRPP-forming) PhnN [Paenalcaligenes niemegkensis]|uniref:phosphonate metabolism protein/1,5-bisphosphokinase (PRPP-forming) PhnN n=1 Tax=Paenalcaligenes niemegkensis TaxID=2895469 RepID=UPI001EE8FE0D|nr:phosphonate metabolism protein/1,5-bisphosphokinase (PRPP-forming) PhnN [Paenalcaligenes niemegkensis]MCQ9616066.1 phosphonate metabolism protein/1,5-bisphosphokinase (PRPP-forming) PhnN [Paenalcaligenes niemegkensis]
MAGRLIYLMGPSGGGKDTILQGVATLLGKTAHLAPRIVTRPVPDSEANAVSVSAAEFGQMESSGALAMAWLANGHAYGISVNIDDILNSGRDVLVNGSRQYLPQACKLYPLLVPVLLDVPVQLLQERLQQRGRESLQQIQQRLERNARFTTMDELSMQGTIIRIDNSGTIENAVHALHASLIGHTGTQYRHGLSSCV